MTFTVGKRVKVVGVMSRAEHLVGKIGILRDIIQSHDAYTVEFSDPIPNGHAGKRSMGNYGYCWDFYPYLIVPYESSGIDGKRVSK